MEKIETYTGKIIIEIIKGRSRNKKKDIKLLIKGSLYAKYKRLKQSITRHIFMKFWTTRQGDLKGFQQEETSHISIIWSAILEEMEECLKSCEEMILNFGI